MKTLAQYLVENSNMGVIDHVIRVVRYDGLGKEASFYIRPLNADGDTLDFQVKGNELLPLQVEYLCEDYHEFTLISHVDAESLKCPYCDKKVREVRRG